RQFLGRRGELDGAIGHVQEQAAQVLPRLVQRAEQGAELVATALDRHIGHIAGTDRLGDTQRVFSAAGWICRTISQLISPASTSASAVTENMRMSDATASALLFAICPSTICPTLA